MPEITVTNQKEWDALPDKFQEFTVINIRTGVDIWLEIKKTPESSRVVAWGSSRVEARESSQVVARESSRVVARESSRVEAWESSVSYAHNTTVTVNLFSFAVCFTIVAAKITKKSKTATIIRPKTKPGTIGWLEAEGIEHAKTAVLFKRVSKDFKTQEGNPWETSWQIGSTVEIKDWKPKGGECGAGKLHACSRPYFCDEFRETEGDKYIAIEISLKDMYAWPNPSYPHKIGFRKGIVLYECDRFGDKLP